MDRCFGCQNDYKNILQFVIYSELYLQTREVFEDVYGYLKLCSDVLCEDHTIYLKHLQSHT